MVHTGASAVIREFRLRDHTGRGAAPGGLRSSRLHSVAVVVVGFVASVVCCFILYLFIYLFIYCLFLCCCFFFYFFLGGSYFSLYMCVFLTYASSNFLRVKVIFK